MIYEFYINKQNKNIKQMMETDNPCNPIKRDVENYILENYSKHKNFDLIYKYINENIVFRGISPKVNYRKTVSTDKSFHYYSKSPIIAAGYTQWPKFRWTFGFFNNSDRCNTGNKEFTNPKEMEIFCQQVLGEGQWIEGLVNDAAKINLYGCKPKIPEGKQNQVVVEENAFYVDLSLSAVKGKLIKYQLKDMFSVCGNYYAI